MPEAEPKRLRRGSAGTKIALCVAADEPSHMAVMLRLARRLEDAGYDVSFVGFLDDQDAVDRAGFRHVALAPQTFPKGAIAEGKQRYVGGRFAPMQLVQDMRLERRAILETRDQMEMLRSLGFDLFIVDGTSTPQAAMALALPTRCVLFHITFWWCNNALPPIWTGILPREDGRLSWRSRLMWFRIDHGIRPMAIWSLMAGLTDGWIISTFLPKCPARSFPRLQRRLLNLVACPAALDLPGPRPQNLVYVDAFLSPEPTSTSWAGLDDVPADRRLIYMSMGTQSWLLREPVALFRRVIEAVGPRDDWFLLLSCGKYVDPESLGPLPPNVRVHPWVPQLEVLQRADVMVTHGGINTIKECVHAGVPMLVLPMGRDQPGNSARVVHHGLGLRGRPGLLSTEDLRAMLEQILNDPGYRQRVRAMGDEFRAAARDDACLRTLEQVLDRPVEEQLAALV